MKEAGWKKMENKARKIERLQEQIKVQVKDRWKLKHEEGEKQKGRKRRHRKVITKMSRRKRRKENGGRKKKGKQEVEKQNK